MARRWESKAVEAQQDAAAERVTTGPLESVSDAARLGDRAALMLARTRALADLQLACAPARRAMLEQAIADLDRRIGAIRRA